jgi:hypothetical protein
MTGEKLVYMAGPITGVSYDGCTSWREYVKRTLRGGIVALSPMRWKEYLSGETLVKSAYPDEKDFPLSTPRGIITRDRWDTTRSDVILTNVLGAMKVSIGTVMELAWADAHRVPIVLVMEPEGNPHDYPMIREVAGFIVPSLDKAIAVIEAILLTDGVK